MIRRDKTPHKKIDHVFRLTFSTCFHYASDVHLRDNRQRHSFQELGFFNTKLLRQCVYHIFSSSLFWATVSVLNKQKEHPWHLQTRGEQQDDLQEIRQNKSVAGKWLKIDAVDVLLRFMPTETIKYGLRKHTSVKQEKFFLWRAAISFNSVSGNSGFHKATLQVLLCNLWVALHKIKVYHQFLVNDMAKNNITLAFSVTYTAWNS